jgi:AraC-like DNA-binding protein
MGEEAARGSTEVALVLPAIAALQARGVPTEPVLAAASIDPALLDRADERVPYARVLAVWEHSARAVKDPAFGVHVAESMPRGALDLMDYLLCTSPTQLVAYRRLARYVRILYDRSLFRVDAAGPVVKIVRSRRDDWGPAACQCREFLWAAVVRRGRDGTGLAWKPRRVAFGHPAHAGSPEAHRFFGRTVEYGLRSDHMWIDRATATLPFRSADSKLSAILLRYADSLLAAVPSQDGFVGQAHHAITGELAGGAISVARGAARLGMSARTFQRKLKEHHTSHRELLDETRYDLASAYLSDPSVSITQLTFILGFADVSAFTRAFKRWSGTTPSAFRRQHAAKPSRATGAKAVQL